MRGNLQLFYACFYIILLALFFYLFGFPSIASFFRRSVMIKESSEDLDTGFQFPSVTVCVDLFFSSKVRPIYDSNDTTASALKKLCKSAEEANGVAECFQNIFYNASEIILKAKTFKDNGALTSEIFAWPFGKCHTMKNSFISLKKPYFFSPFLSCVLMLEQKG